MKIRFVPMIVLSMACCALPAVRLAAQNSIQVFGPVDVRLSEATTSYSNPSTFNTNNLNLTCPTSPTGFLSSVSVGGVPGNVLVDNILTVAVSSGGTVISGPTNVCPATGIPGPSAGLTSCFTAGYESPASTNSLLGQNPDNVIPGTSLTLDQVGGVAPIIISSLLVPGPSTVTISLIDDGGYLASSSLYLNTNCTQAGVTGPATVSGNPINNPPTGPELTQTFNFNGSNNQVVGFVYDLSEAETDGTLTVNPNGSTPQVTDLPVNPDPTKFLTHFTAGTSFATSQCLIHNGEVGGPPDTPATNPACKLYTLECTTGTGSAEAGANCPISTVSNEVVKDIFDGPPFSLSPDGATYHEGIGFLMASEGWGSESGVPPGTWDWDGGVGGPCTFDPEADLNLPCPQNLLTSFTGPGIFSGSGETTHPNSTFISLANVPEPLTTVAITGASSTGNWVNVPNPTVSFTATPPNLAGSTLPGAASFTPAPIQSVTYGVSPFASPTPPVPANEPIANDVTLPNPNGPCPIPPAGTWPNPGATFGPVTQTLNAMPDGQYLLHYYAQDCAGTQELWFQNLTGSWTTSFYTVPVNIDTVAPAISSLAAGVGLPGNGSYAQNAVVKASYSCTDAGSGVVSCTGTTSNSTGTTNTCPATYSAGTPNTGTLTCVLPTKTVGTNTLSVAAIDLAGNHFTSSATYKVIGPTAPHL